MKKLTNYKNEVFETNIITTLNELRNLQIALNIACNYYMYDKKSPKKVKELSELYTNIDNLYNFVNKCFIEQITKEKKQ